MVAFAAVAFIVAALVGVISFSTTRHGLDDEINRSLASAATTLAAGGTVPTTTTDNADGGGRPAARPGLTGSSRPRRASRRTVRSRDRRRNTIPVDPQTTALTAATAGSEVFRTVQLNGHTYRVLSQALGADRGVIEVARDLTDTQHVLEDLAWTTLWVGLGAC